MLLLLFIYIVCKMDITKLLRVLKKRELSNQLDSGEQENKSKGRTFSGEPGSGWCFYKYYGLPECMQILLKCLRSVEEIHELQ